MPRKEYSKEDLAVMKAREWINTPWKHQGRIKGVGSDCVGLIVGVANEIGLKVKDIKAYPREPNGTLEFELSRQLEEVDINDLRIGNIGLFCIASVWNHVGIFGDRNGTLTLIHIHQSLGKCVEHIYDSRWSRRLQKVYRWPN